MPFGTRKVQDGLVGKAPIKDAANHPEPSSVRRTDKPSQTTGFLAHRLSSFGLHRSGTDIESREDIRGPLGLNLLHEPSDPLIDFIFVHGLRGGSRKTWSKTESMGHFWPKAWLPVDPKFKNVRIHSFGYNSDWSEKAKSILTVHDFGQALLGDMFISPQLNSKGHKTPMVMIGHSMGGVVIKKAFLLAKQDPQYHSLAGRIHTMFFLATPHRGADSAQLLRNMTSISVVHKDKAYVADLIPDSGAIQIINDEFRHAYQGVHLWSFFETLPTSLGIIVAKNSAVIGLPGERIQLLNADHRNVCKFEDKDDNNYRTLRNAFALTVDDVEKTHLSAGKEQHRLEMQRLAQYLGGAGRPEADLATVLEQKLPGTCEWISEKPSFQKWINILDDTPRYYWLRGEPATGKSTLAAHIIDYLRKRNRESSFFFFRSGDSTRSTIASMLLSLAWQLSEAQPAVRRELMERSLEGVILDKADERSIWQTIFSSCILDCMNECPHYWIIDALDECPNSSVLFALFAKIPGGVPLRILITSHPSIAMEKMFSQANLPVIINHIERADSLDDIKLFLETRAHNLPFKDEGARRILIDQMLQKSGCNFLWTALTFRELEETSSEEQISAVLESVPREMNDVYKRKLNMIMINPRNIGLAKAIFRWVVCAARPLLAEELKEAIKLDIHETPHNLEKDAGPICGHMVYVDGQRRVHIAHQTVRAFLVQEGLSSEFAVVRPQAHSRVAEVCLKYLCGDEMKTPRHRRGTVTSQNTKRSVFSDYAAMQFSEHVARATSAIDAPFIALNSFFQGNVLTWIESIALTQDLGTLTQTAKNLKIYLERRAKYRSRLGQEMSNVSAWANDIIHLVARFGRPLLTSPSSIHFLLPPVCPPESVIFKSFRDYPKNLHLVGLSQNEWNDQLNCTIYAETQAYCVASCTNCFAVGLADGSIRLYNEFTCQEELRFSHGEGVRDLKIPITGTHVAAASRRKITMWDLITRSLLWTVTAPDVLLAIEFNLAGTVLLATTQTESLISLCLENGNEDERVQFSDVFEGDQVNKDHKQRPSKLAKGYRRPPNLTVISTELNLLAVGYRARPVTFWDLTDSSYVGQIWRTSDEFQLAVVALVFNPNPDLDLIAAAYQDGSILTFELWGQRKCGDTGPVGALILAVSPDGTILASADFAGVITLFDFETLKTLYKVNYLEQSIRQIVFSSSGLRFYDVRGDRCSVWEPSVLIRRHDTQDDSSFHFSEGIPFGPEVVSNHATGNNIAISAITAHHDGNTIFCGLETGVVMAYSSQTGQPFQKISRHPGTFSITLLAWNEAACLLTSVDQSDHVLVQKLSLTPSKIFNVTDPIMSHRSTSPVRQTVTSPNGKQLLVSTASAGKAWDVQTGSLVGEHLMTWSGAWQWINHPNEPYKLLLVGSDKIRIFHWEDLSELTEAGRGGVDRVYSGVRMHDRVNVIAPSQSRIICVIQTAIDATDNNSLTSIRFYPANFITPETPQVGCLADLDKPAADLKTVIGIYGTGLCYLDHNGWVCSIDINNVNAAQESYSRHFFIPFQLHNTTENILMLNTSRGSVALAVGHELAMFHNGLAFREIIDMEGKPLMSAKPSLRSNRKRLSAPI